MNTTYRSCELKSGETMTIEVLEPPIPGAAPSSRDEFDRSYNGFPVHFGWKDVGEQLLRGDYSQWSRDRFFVGKISEEVVGSVLLHTPADSAEIGLTLHVLTKTRHWNKGVQTRLYEALVEQFTGEGGMMLYLPTGNPIAARLYRNAGFVNHVGDGMRYLSPGNGDFDDTYLEYAGQASIRGATWGDLAGFALLHNNTRLDWLVRFYTPFVDWKVFSGFRFLGHYRRLITDVEQQKGLR